MITYRVSQKYITRNSSYSLTCQFLLHSWYFLMKLLLISVQLEHFKEFERNIDQVGCPKNANIYVKFLFQLPPLPLILLFSRAGVNTQTHLYIPRNGRIGIYDQFGCWFSVALKGRCKVDFESDSYASSSLSLACTILSIQWEARTGVWVTLKIHFTTALYSIIFQTTFKMF